MRGKHQWVEESMLRVITVGFVLISNNHINKKCFVCTVNVSVSVHRDASLSTGLTADLNSLQNPILKSLFFLLS